MGLNILTLGSSKTYTDESLIGLGSLKGAPCTIKSITEVEGGQKVTFEWTGTSGTKQTSEMTVKNGVSITSISIDANNNLVCTMSDGTEYKSKIDLLDNVYTKTETDTLLLDKAEKNHNHDSAYASKDTEHEHTNKETLDKFGVNDGGKLTFNGDVVTPEAMDLGDYLKKTDAQNTYVEKETGKGLSENDFTTVLKDAYDKAVEDSHTHPNGSVIDKFSESADGALLYDGQSIEADLSTVYKKTETYSQTEADNKFVAKESGKGLSANDLTDELKSSYDDAVTAKHTHDNKTVLDGITAEKVESWDKAEANVQSDWNETDDTADGFIKNKPTIPDAYDDSALSGRVDDVETSIGDMSLIEVKSVSDLVSAINALYNAFMSSITYADKKLTITYRNGGTVDIDMSAIITDTNIGELSNIDDTGVADKQVLSYDTATNKYIPTTIDTAGVLADAKKYTDDEIAKINNADAMAVDEKPTYSDGTITYKKGGVESTITDGDFWFFYTVDDMAYQTIWIDGVEFTTSVDGSVDFKDFVSKTNDLVSTYTGEETDKTKVTTIASLDALYAIISTSLGKKVNTTDIVDSLSSDSTDKPLSAAQGKALDTKISDLVTTVEEDYAKKTDLHSHENKTVLDGITEEKVTAWDKAQENIIESVKVNNQEITPDENKAVNIDLTGYAEHDEIVGENLIPFPYAQPERTTNGITFTFADDGSVIANGTATENADFSVCVRTNFGTDAALMLKPGIYAITGCPEGGSDSTYRIQVQFGDKTELKYSLKADYGKGFVFEVTEEYAQYACQIQCHVQKGYTVTDLVFKPMLVLGSVLKEYQPYKLSRESLRTDIADVTELASRVDNQFATATGDYITVNDSVDGKLVELGIKGNSFQQTYSGKNLFNATLKTTTLNGVTCTNNGDGTYTLNGTASSDVYFNLGNVNIIPGNKYRLCCTKSDTAMKAYAEKGLSGYEYNTLTATSSIANVTVSIKSGIILSNVRIKPMLTTDLNATYDDFEPYVGGTPSPSPSYPQEINSVGDDGSLVVKSCGKNLIPYPYYNGSDTRVGVTATVNLDSSITLKGTATSNYFFVLLHRNANGKGFAKKLRGKTVTISGGTSRPVLSFAVYDENGNNITPPNNEMVYDYGSGVTITIPDNACDMYSYYYFSSENTVNVTLRPQLEVSDVVTVYEPYKSSTATIPLSEPLRAIGDVKDEITYQDGKWGVLRRTGKYVVDGTESWVLDSEHIVDCGISARLGSYANILKGISSVTGNTKDMITDYLRCRELDHIPYYAASNGVQEDKGSGTYRTPGNIWISFGASDIEKMGITKDIDSVKAWLSSHNITFIYPLGAPVFEPFADQTLPYLSTYDGVTNISNDDALSAEMTVKYPTTDASGVGSRNESRIAELAKDTDDKFDDVNDSLSVIGKCKNLLNPTLQTTTHDGITCTNNGDGTYTLNGTCSVDSPKTTIIVTSESMKIDEDVKFICCTQSGSSDTFRASVDYDDGTYSVDYGEGTLLSKGKTITKVSIIISNGATVNNLVFKPMLTTNLNATYNDFVPYTGEGETLTHDVAKVNDSLGSTDISAIGDGTVTGAISSIYSNLGTQVTYSLNGTTLSITTKE